MLLWRSTGGSCQWFWAGIDSANSRISISLDVCLWRHQTERKDKSNSVNRISIPSITTRMEGTDRANYWIPFTQMSDLQWAWRFLSIFEERIIGFCCAIKRNIAYSLNTTLHTNGQKYSLFLFFNIKLCKLVYMGQFLSWVNTRISQKWILF